MNRDFRSDNTQGCSAEVLEALARATAGTTTSYGGDEITARVRERCRDLFECDLEVFPVITGTAGNALAIAAMTPPDGSVLCHEDAHIVRDELGAPEFFTGGARMIAVPGAHGKLWNARPSEANDLRSDPRVILSEAKDLPSSPGEGPSPSTRLRMTPGAAAEPPLSCLSLTNATEGGTVYTPDELRALTQGHQVHLDGARFANAVVSTGASPADLTWRAGVDILVFGGTKNGLLGAELIVVFTKALAAAIAPLWHRSGHRPSKMRFLSAQFEAYLTDDLWLRNGRHANAMAARLAAGLPVIHEVQANVVFTRFPKEVAKALEGDGFQFYDWPIFGDDAWRLVTGFATTEADVDGFLEAYRRVQTP